MLILTKLSKQYREEHNLHNAYALHISYLNTLGNAKSDVNIDMVKPIPVSKAAL